MTEIVFLKNFKYYQNYYKIYIDIDTVELNNLIC